jgi:hypothetical protein
MRSISTNGALRSPVTTAREFMFLCDGPGVRFGVPIQAPSAVGKNLPKLRIYLCRVP